MNKNIWKLEIEFIEQVSLHFQFKHYVCLNFSNLLLNIVFDCCLRVPY